MATDVRACVGSGILVHSQGGMIRTEVPYMPASRPGSVAIT